MIATGLYEQHLKGTGIQTIILVIAGRIIYDYKTVDQHYNILTYRLLSTMQTHPRVQIDYLMIAS